MDPEKCLAPYVRQLTSNQLEAVVQTLCAPLPVLRAVGRATLLHENLIVRHTALTLLCTMMTQARNFVAALDKWAVFGGDDTMARDRFTFKISKVIFLNHCILAVLLNKGVIIRAIIII